jgi:hypothetical protein
MVSAPAERTGLLVVRAWVDDGKPSLRARITRLVDTDQPVQVVTTTSDPEEIRSEVEAWLEAFLAR